MIAANTVAQAKLNLRLQVLAREQSGYHSIETIFHRIELGDDVTVTLMPGGTRTITMIPDTVPRDSNLAWKAGNAFCDVRGWQTGFHIEITKRIPSGGGLGGGSADAAAVLRIMNDLAPRKVRNRDVLTIAGSLGADVAFLASDAPMAIAWSRGERMIALPALPQRHVALVYPGFTVSTAEAYARVQLSDAMPMPYASPRVTTLADLTSWTHEIGLGPRAWFAGNSLAALPLDATQRASVQKACEALADAGADFGGVTGSGSTIFGIFEDAPDSSALGAACGMPVALTRTSVSVEPVVRLD